MSDLDLTEAEAKVTYDEIREYVIVAVLKYFKMIK